MCFYFWVCIISDVDPCFCDMKTYKNKKWGDKILILITNEIKKELTYRKLGGRGNSWKWDINCMLWGIFGCHLLPIKVICLSVLFFIFISLCNVIYSHTTAHSFSFCKFITEQIFNISIDFTTYALIQEVIMTSGNPLGRILGVCGTFVCIHMWTACACTIACVECFWVDVWHGVCISCSAETLPAHTTTTECLRRGLFKAALRIIN